MDGTPGLGLVAFGGLMILAGAALVFVGCAQEEPISTDAGQSVVDFQPRQEVDRCTGQGATRRCRVVWEGDVVIGGRAAATGITYEGEGIDVAGSTVRGPREAAGPAGRVGTEPATSTEGPS